MKWEKPQEMKWKREAEKKFYLKLSDMKRKIRRRQKFFGVFVCVTLNCERVFDGGSIAASSENADNCLTAVRHIFDGILYVVKHIQLRSQPAHTLQHFNSPSRMKKNVERPNRAYK